MNYNLDTVAYDKLVMVGGGEVSVETAARDETGKIKKVLALTADCRVLAAERIGDEVAVSGRISYKLMYVDETDELKNLDYYADFADKLQVEGEAGKVFAEAEVQDCGVSFGGGIKFNAVVKFAIYSIASLEAKCLQNADESLYVERGEVALSRHIGTVRECVSLSDSFETRAQVQSVLLLDFDAIVSDVNAGMDTALVQGKALAMVTYLADDELKTTTFRLGFSEEIAVEGLKIGDKVTADAKCKNGKVILGGVEGDNVIEIELVVELTLQAYSMSASAVIKDIFSVETELQTEANSLDMLAPTSGGSFQAKLSGGVALEEDMPEIKQLISVATAKNSVAKVVRSEVEKDTLIIEGVVTACVLYSDENGINSVEANLPYSESFALEGELLEAEILTAAGMVEDVYVKAKRGREFEVFAELCFMVKGAKNIRQTVISSVVEGEAKEQNKSALSVYIAEAGDGIWEVAKALSAKPDQILKQNPNVELPFKGGEKVVFFRQIASC